MCKSLQNFLVADKSTQKDFKEVMKEILATHDEFFRKLWKDTSYYTYLLLDVSKFNGKSLKDVTFAEFIEAIEFIGEGYGSKVFQHYWDALIWDPKSGKKVKCLNKLKAIRELIKNDQLRYIRSSQLASEEECLSKEGAMIEAIGLPNLLNTNSGAVYHDWSDKVITKLNHSQKTNLLGVACLRQFYKSRSTELKGFERVPSDKKTLKMYKALRKNKQ